MEVLFFFLLPSFLFKTFPFPFWLFHTVYFGHIFSSWILFTSLQIHLNVLLFFSFSVFWTKNKNSKQTKNNKQRDPQLENVQRMNDFGTLVVMGCLHQTPPFKTQISVQKRTKKGCKTRGSRWYQGHSVIQTQQDWCTREDMETVAAYVGLHKFKLYRVVELTGKNTDMILSFSSQQIICDWYLLAKRKLICSKGVSVGI